MAAAAQEDRAACVPSSFFEPGEVSAVRVKAGLPP